MLRINRHTRIEDAEGKKHTWGWIETEFQNAFKDEIVRGLKDKVDHEVRSDRKEFWDWCWKGVKDENWLIAKPDKLLKVTEEVDANYTDLLAENKNELRDAVAKVFGYDHKKLLDLAKWLNVKTCPYCNMQYTLYVHGQTKKARMAKFQFDHFYDKAEYPMLSMSLCNLIPSCASCNQGKSKGKLGLEFHPYHAAIKDAFHFEVEKPVPLWEGSDADVSKIQMVANDGYDLGDFNKMFHVERLYQRHKDEARDTFARAYADTYYKVRENFGFLKDKKLKERIIMGCPPDEEDIDKRPLTKLKQDLWKQAKGIDWRKMSSRKQSI